MQNDDLTALISCAICSQPITQRIIRADERGKAVHEECYVRKISAQSVPRPQSQFRLG
jgi:hypothetical protein